MKELVQFWTTRKSWLKKDAKEKGMTLNSLMQHIVELYYYQNGGK